MGVARKIDNRYVTLKNLSRRDLAFQGFELKLVQKLATQKLCIKSSALLCYTVSTFSAILSRKNRRYESFHVTSLGRAYPNSFLALRPHKNGGKR